MLIIEHSKKEKEVTQENEIKAQISGMSNDDIKLPFENKLKLDIDKLTMVRQQKIKKFKSLQVDQTKSPRQTKTEICVLQFYYQWWRIHLNLQYVFTSCFYHVRFFGQKTQTQKNPT